MAERLAAVAAVAAPASVLVWRAALGRWEGGWRGRVGGSPRVCGA